MKRILVALDGSPRAAAVAARAAEIAKATSSQLFLIHVVNLPVELPADAYRTSPAEVLESLRTAAALELERIAGTLDDDVVSHILVRVGAPWPTICDAALEHEADLVVIGSHGHRFIDNVLGTTAAKVVTHCDKSVLVVRD